MAKITIEELAMSPTTLFNRNRDFRQVSIPELANKPTDEFFVISAANYPAAVRKSIEDSKRIPPQYKQYISLLMDVISGTQQKATAAKKILIQNKKTYEATLDIGKIENYFSELATPINLINHGYKSAEILFPVRPNYEVYDFFMKVGKEKSAKLIGYSVKAKSGSTNTLSARFLQERIKSLSSNNKLFTALSESQILGRDVIITLGENKMSVGPVKAVQLLCNKSTFSFPSTVNATAANSLKKMTDSEWKSLLDASMSGLEKNLDRAVSSKTAYAKIKTFLDNFLFPSNGKERVVVDKKQKEKYISSNSYNVNNLIYALLTIITDASKEQIIQLSPTVYTVFPNLFVTKMSVKSTGYPTFTVNSLRNYSTNEPFVFRNKQSFTRPINDKLGIAI